ncbi:MAG: dihydrofolate reductase family protein [Caulobacteraceae bacterium]
MRKVIASAFVSVDGVMQAPGGPAEDPTGGFRFGGWTAPYFDESLGGVMGEMFSRPFSLLLGRKTYDIFAAHWPYAGEDDPIGALFGDMTKYVATRNPDLRLDWKNSLSLGPDAVAGVKRLKAEDGPDLLTQGSSDFLQTLFAADLVDELTVLMFPVILGSGKRLFQGGAAPLGLKLVSSMVSDSGVMVGKYARDGAVRTGDFQHTSPSEAELERRRNLS